MTQNCAGIGQDPGLMGRVGRVVLCGERDGVLFRGMSLNHICLELDGEIDGWQISEQMSATGVLLCCPTVIPPFIVPDISWLEKDYHHPSS